jgi:hypothetical protein
MTSAEARLQRAKDSLEMVLRDKAGTTDVAETPSFAKKLPFGPIERASDYWLEMTGGWDYRDSERLRASLFIRKVRALRCVGSGKDFDNSESLVAIIELNDSNVLAIEGSHGHTGWDVGAVTVTFATSVRDALDFGLTENARRLLR